MTCGNLSLRPLTSYDRNGREKALSKNVRRTNTKPLGRRVAAHFPRSISP
jgi:hypothetical protein